MYAVMGGLGVIKADYPGRPSTSWLAGWRTEWVGLVYKSVVFFKNPIKKILYIVS